MVKRELQIKKKKKQRRELHCLGVQMLQEHVNFLWHLFKKVKSLECFKKMYMTKLPVHYFSQKKAWMTATIFEKWFHNFFVPLVKTFCADNGIEYTNLLLVDNAPAHPSTDCLQSTDGKVTTMFLPANTVLPA